MADNRAVEVARKALSDANNAVSIVQSARPTGLAVHDTVKVYVWDSAHQAVRTYAQICLAALVFEAFLNTGSTRAGKTLDDGLANLPLSECLTPTEATRVLRNGRSLSGNDTINWLTTALMAKLAECDLSPRLVATAYTGHGGDLVLVQDDAAYVV
jgi:hypothetical protein